MKIFKISLVLIAIGILVWVAYSFFKEPPPLVVVPTASNPFIDEIKNKTDSLSKMSKKTFCVDFYNTIHYDIEAYSEANKIDTAWKEVLLKDLDYQYVPILISQANYVFGGTEWELYKLAIIRYEVNKLLLSKYIDNKSKLYKVKTVLNTYDEIVSFIAEANDFEGINYSSTIQKFDLVNANKYISKAAKYDTIDGYVGNCERLMTQLENIPNLMYNKHLDFLTLLVKSNLGKYKTRLNYNDYYNEICYPIFEEFDNFIDNYSNYSVTYTDASSAVSALKSEMKQDKIAAQSYSYKK